jgi:hypothetical protein
MHDRCRVTLALEMDLGVVDRARSIGQQDQLEIDLSAAPAGPPATLATTRAAPITRRITASSLGLSSSFSLDGG